MTDSTATPTPRPALLCIDDDAMVHRIVTHLVDGFRYSRYDCDFASSYEDGLVKLVNGTYAVCLLDYQLDFQRKQIRDAPDQERAILATLYVERGFGPEEADRFVDAVFADPDHAVRLLIFEEVGLDARSIGSPLAAAAGSFVAFTTGAFIPLVPYLVGSGTTAFVASLVVSLTALGVLGAGIAALTRRPAWYGALRQVCLGAVAAGFTYAVGLVIGVGAP